MVFPVISKFNAELVKKSLSCCARDNVKYKLFKHSRATNSQAKSSEFMPVLVISKCP